MAAIIDSHLHTLHTSHSANFEVALLYCSQGRRRPGVGKTHRYDDLKEDVIMKKISSNTRRLSVISAVALSAVLVAGCAAGNGSTTNSASPEGAGPSGEFTLEATGFSPSDMGTPPEAGLMTDSGMPDMGTPPDMGTMPGMDSSSGSSSGMPSMGTAPSGSMPSDMGTPPDMGLMTDSGMPDMGTPPDMGSMPGMDSSSGMPSMGQMPSDLGMMPGQETSTIAAGSSAVSLDTSDQFTSRDMDQSPDLSQATYITVVSGQDVTITEEGIYVISGSATDVTIWVEADDSAKVQLVLDGLNVTNADMPVIYGLTADKIFVTTASGSVNSLSVTGEFADGSAVVQSKTDLVLNGEGTLKITSATGKGVKSSDDLKITGGTYVVTSYKHAFEANDSIRIAGGTFTVTSQAKDAFHAENEDDDSLGYIYISGGSFTINAASDGFEGDAFVVIDGGTFNITAAEGIEGTYVEINGGTINISASDDAINASIKSSTYACGLVINGGSITIKMGSGDTDALDSNGFLYINGGTVDITAQSPFDYDGQGSLSANATVTVNGSRITSLYNQFMGGDMMGGFGMMGDAMGQQGDMGNMSGQMPSDMGQAPSGSMGQVGPQMRA